MTPPIQPFVCEPIFKEKPWGGRVLAERFGKSLPAGDVPIGESWELVSLPGNESRVARGPLARRSLSELQQEWDAGLLGGVPPVDGRFPLLIKFLDARQHLSVQVHPKPAADDPEGWAPGIKHEAWCILAAEPGAELFIGLRPGVTPADLQAAANTPAFADLLQRWPASPGDCYYLPSGTVHALGAGIVVAEVQTPSDTTYRFYDWDRVGLDGRPRPLHIEAALANTRFDVPNDEIRQAPTPVGDSFVGARRVVACRRFTIDAVDLAASDRVAGPPLAELRIWILLSGSLKLNGPIAPLTAAAGDVVVVPAGSRDTWVRTDKLAKFLEVRVPSP